MLAIKVTCPHCGKHLRSAKPLPAGKRVVCSHCGRGFAVPGEPTPAPVTRTEAGIRTAVESPPPPTTAAPEPARPTANGHPVAEPFPPAGSGRTAIWAGIVIGGLLVLLGTTVGLAVYFGGKKEPAHAVAGPRPGESPPGETAPTPPDVPQPTPPSNDPDVPLGQPRKENPTPQKDPKSDQPPEIPLPQPIRPSRPGSGVRGPLPSAEQTRVNNAIDRGVEYLRRSQSPGGTWGGGRVGLAALPGLTLLECGVKGDDPCVQKAATYVREHAADLNTTYDLALSILFLDRLGEQRDEVLIRVMALRLIAGQAATGGWTYDCPVLRPKEQLDLMILLRDTRPASPLELFVPGPGEPTPPGLMTKGSDGRPGPQPVVQEPGGNPAGGLFLPKAQPGLDRETNGPGSKAQPTLPGGSTLPGGKAGDNKPGSTVGNKNRKPGQLSPEGLRALRTLSPRLRETPALKPPVLAKNMPRNDARRTDNSNTQFATLGLWAASRHGVPTERALALVDRRFRTSQKGDGHWDYQYPQGGHFTPAMTGSGLLGLAVGHGLTITGTPGHGPKRSVKDPAINKGLGALSDYIGNADQSRNHYFLWTVERVGMLYNLSRIGGKDWYKWGSETLVKNQHGDGSWNEPGTYPGAAQVPDTCFALLFLKRANFTQEITQGLDFFIEGKGMRDQR